MAHPVPFGGRGDPTGHEVRVALAWSPGLPETTPAVRFDDAAVDLGGRTIWSGATFAIPSGAFVGLIGGNGAGEATLLRVLLGQITPSRGRVEILGAPPRRGNRAIGYVPQRRTIELDLAVRGSDFVLLGLTGHGWGFGRPSDAERRSASDALAAVDALEFADEPIGVLSGGEQQRLLIAQALVTQPRLLLLDEPLASLDLRSQQEIVALVDRLRREHRVAVILVAHDLNRVLGDLERVIYIVGGCPIAAPLGEVLDADLLTRIYGAPIRVARTTDGEPVIIGA